MVKVLMVLTSHGYVEGAEPAKNTGWYLPELAHPFFRFKKAGYDIDLCSINGGDTTVTENSLDMNDPENKEFWETPEFRGLTQGTRALSEFNGNDYDLIFFVGGFGTMWDFPNAESVSTVAAAVYEHGGTVAAVCHGPICFANITLSNGELLIKGRPVCAFTNEEEEHTGMNGVLPQFKTHGTTPGDILTSLGGNYSKGPEWAPYVVGEDRVYSGQNPASAGPLADTIIASL